MLLVVGLKRAAVVFFSGNCIVLYKLLDIFMANSFHFGPEFSDLLGGDGSRQIHLLLDSVDSLVAAGVHPPGATH